MTPALHRIIVGASSNYELLALVRHETNEGLRPDVPLHIVPVVVDTWGLLGSGRTN
jgi:hypothetical protein